MASPLLWLRPWRNYKKESSPKRASSSARLERKTKSGGVKLVATAFAFVNKGSIHAILLMVIKLHSTPAHPADSERVATDRLRQVTLRAMKLPNHRMMTLADVIQSRRVIWIFPSHSLESMIALGLKLSNSPFQSLLIPIVSLYLISKFRWHVFCVDHRETPPLYLILVLSFDITNR